MTAIYCQVSPSFLCLKIPSFRRLTLPKQWGNLHHREEMWESAQIWMCVNLCISRWVIIPTGLCPHIPMPVMQFCSSRIRTDCWHYGSKDIVGSSLATLVGVVTLALWSRARTGRGRWIQNSKKNDVRKVQKMKVVTVNKSEIILGLHTLKSSVTENTAKNCFSNIPS